ncbi:hypothetical protein LR69_03504 [Geobacillus sp. BCO2]|nr:hypothetical protein LR69_03504 [Geobacillus sp. BCO2]
MEQAAEVEEHSLREGPLGVALMLDMHDDESVFPFHLCFDQQVDAMLFPSRHIGEQFFGEEREMVNIDVLVHVRKEKKQKLFEKRRQQLFEQPVMIDALFGHVFPPCNCRIHRTVFALRCQIPPYPSHVFLGMRHFRICSFPMSSGKTS